MRKFIAPIIVTVVVILYYILYFCLILVAFESLAAKILLGIIPIILSVVILYVCVQRINEIRSGEEDDLSKY